MYLKDTFLYIASNSYTQRGGLLDPSRQIKPSQHFMSTLVAMLLKISI